MSCLVMSCHRMGLKSDFFQRVLTRSGDNFFDPKPLPFVPVVVVPDFCKVTFDNFLVKDDTKLSTKAKTAIILPNLKSSNLMSIGQLCDDRYEIKKYNLKVRRVQRKKQQDKTDFLEKMKQWQKYRKKSIAMQKYMVKPQESMLIHLVAMMMIFSLLEKGKFFFIPDVSNYAGFPT